MSNLAKFISGDGVEHEVEVGSPAFEHMTKDGSFKRLDAPAEESATEITETSEEVVYSEAEAIEQNDGVDESSAAKEAAAGSATETAETGEKKAKGKK